MYDVELTRKSQIKELTAILRCFLTPSPLLPSQPLTPPFPAPLIPVFLALLVPLM